MTWQQEWWTVPQVAAELQVDAETVRRWIRKGHLKALLLGSTRGGYRIARADLEAFVSLNYAKPLGERPEPGNQMAA